MSHYAHFRVPVPKSIGFTLAELLIALAILGVIATFTIPKVLTAQRDAQNNAIPKEVVGMVAGGFDAYKLEKSVTSTTSAYDLIAYMNYIKRDTTSLMDDSPTYTTYQCDSGGAYCLKLHNGAMLYVRNWVNFAGTNNTNAIYFSLDPDGVPSAAKSVNIFLYYNGRMTSHGYLSPNTVSSDATRGADLGLEPSWFRW